MARSIAKITRPVLKGIVARPRLFRQLDRLLRRHSIVWVSAPAGSGKTTLAASWLAARRRPCLWYQIDAGDADPATFFYYMREAVQRLSPRRREPLPFLTPEYAFGLSAYTRNFLEGVGARVPPRTVLVLDQDQECPEEAPLQSLLPPALPALPEVARVLVLSRSAPPPPFARLITEGTVGFLAADELTLTEEETRALARARVGQSFSAAAAADLRDRTCGWMAATLLLLEAPTRPLPARRGSETATQQLLFDYFAVEIFDRAPPRTQRLLLATSLLAEVSVAAAETLAGEPRAAEILADLVRRNYFTLRLAGHEARYRYHPLFREFLLSRARYGTDGPAWRDLAARSADLLGAAGNADDAATILARAGDHNALARLILTQAPGLAFQGRLASVESWIRALPEVMVKSDPWLTYWLGVCRAMDIPRARTLLEASYRTFRARGDLTGVLLAWAGFVTTSLYVLDDFGSLDPWIADMEELHRSGLAFPSIDVEAQVTGGMFASLWWRNPAHPDLGHWENRAVALLDSQAAPELRMNLATSLMFHRVSWGDFAGARHVFDRVSSLLGASDVRPVTEVLWHHIEAYYGAHSGDAAACFAAVERGLATAERTGVRGLNHSLAMQGVKGALAAGDLAAARRYHSRAGECLSPGEKGVNLAQFHHLAAWIALCAGDFQRAEEQARTCLKGLLETGAEMVQRLQEFTLGHVLVERGEHDAAAELIEGAMAWCRRARNPSGEYECLLSLSYAAMRRGREVEALEWLRAGMRLGRERGLITRTWIGWRRDVVARLAAKALEHGVEVEYVQGLIRARGLVAPEEAASLDAWPWSIRIRTLGGFELQRDGEPVEFGRRSRRPIELLQLLIANGGEVTAGTLADALWPDAEGDLARHALGTTLYRLRRFLGPHVAITGPEGAVALNAATCWTDLHALRKRMQRVAVLCERDDADGAVLLRETEKLVELYRGPFLPHVEAPWAEASREHLRSALARHLGTARGVLERAGYGAPAEHFLQQVFGADPGLPISARLPVVR